MKFYNFLLDNYSHLHYTNNTSKQRCKNRKIHDEGLSCLHRMKEFLESFICLWSPEKVKEDLQTDQFVDPLFLWFFVVFFTFCIFFYTIKISSIDSVNVCSLTLTLWYFGDKDFALCRLFLWVWIISCCAHF